jgi:hypothetical protein
MRERERERGRKKKEEATYRDTSVITTISEVITLREG